MGNSYSIYRFSYHIFSDSTHLLINCQKNIIQHKRTFWTGEVKASKYKNKSGNHSGFSVIKTNYECRF